MSKIAPIALTIGEPGGVGPELALKAWLRRTEDALSPFCVLAPLRIIEQAVEQTGFNIPVVCVPDISETHNVFPNALPVLDLDDVDAPIVSGTASPATAKIVIDSITRAVALTHTNAASAVVTNPIQKSALYAAGFKHPGHTEFLAELAGPGTIPVMMLANSKLRVVPLTIHIALSEVPKQLTSELIGQLCHITANAMKRDFGVANPRIAIAGINPHAGEDGTIGLEEQTIMIPAIQKLRDEGLNVIGPMPADTMFHEEARAEYDVALCPYHDQALIPVKTLDFHGGVNVTLGLPFIRTSPDHGTALNIAGKGIARPDSLISALKMAADMADKRLSTGA